MRDEDKPAASGRPAEGTAASGTAAEGAAPSGKAAEGTAPSGKAGKKTTTAGKVRKKVVVLGAGVAGLSAAHLLVRRGFDVEVYEMLDAIGGKARSVFTKGGLPGEHGFRFFPGFYKHLPATLAEIPLADRHGATVIDNLVPAMVVGVSQVGRPTLEVPARFPQTWAGLERLLTLLAYWRDLGLPGRDLRRFAFKLINVAQMSEVRRRAELKAVTWWDYIDADEYGKQYQDLLARGLTRALVALRAEVGCTYTVARILIQLFMYIALPGREGDRLLNQPTSLGWLDHWQKYLTGDHANGATVQIHTEATANVFVTDSAGNIEGVGISFVDGSGVSNQTVAGDYYVLAEAAQNALFPLGILRAEVFGKDTAYDTIQNVQMAWMNGVQFYLGKPWADLPGQTIHVDSAWSLTSVSQRQFWSGYDFEQLVQKGVQGVLSVDVSDWYTPGTVTTKKPATDCTLEELVKEVWAQLCESEPSLKAIKYVGTNLDPDLWGPPPPHVQQALKLPSEFDAKNLTNIDPTWTGGWSNLEPLMVNTVQTEAHRPPAKTVLPNLFLASDYVHTYTDLATMEGANEAARRAVNHLLDQDGSDAPRAELWPFEEVPFLGPLRWLDRKRFEEGKSQLELKGFWMFVLAIAGCVLGFVGWICRPFLRPPADVN